MSSAETPMTAAQKHTLELLADAPMNAADVCVYRVRATVLSALRDVGLARYAGKAWKITKAGRDALAQAES